jgi:dihydropteroate synthase
VRVFGVINASPDSLDHVSVATTPAGALERARQLLADGADGVDVGGQASTPQAAVVSASEEWARLAPLVPTLATLGVPLSVDTWRPEVMRQALAAGANAMNAADGMQSEAMWEVAAEHHVPIVIPFLSGPDPKHMVHVTDDPIAAIVDFFEVRLATAERYGLRDLCLLDPGTGFAPPDWPWQSRYEYQKVIYGGLGALRRFERPLYVALPWRTTPQHEELLELALTQAPDYARAHRPRHVREVQRRLATTDRRSVHIRQDKSTTGDFARRPNTQPRNSG